jgi:hypothetical protein
LDDAEWLSRQGKRFSREAHIAWCHSYANGHARRVGDEIRRGMGCDSSFDAEFFAVSKRHPALRGIATNAFAIEAIDSDEAFSEEEFIARLKSL